MRKYKKRLIIISSIVILIFFVKQIYNWYKPYREAKNLFGIDVPLAAKVKLFEQWSDFFDGSGETRIVFDVSKLKNEMKQLVEEKNFIRSDNEKLIIIKRDSPKVKTTFTDQNIGLSLGLKGGYYLPYYESIGMRGKKVVIYNLTDGILLFYDQQTR